MAQKEEQIKLRSLSVDVEIAKPIMRRKYAKNAESQLISRRTNLKIIRFDDHIFNSPTIANVVNLEFGQENQQIFKRSNNRKVARKMAGFAQQRKAALLQKQISKTRYQQMFKDTMNYFFTNTIQINPYTKMGNNQCELEDHYCKRKLINLQKLTFSLRGDKRQVTSRRKFQTMINRTSRNAGQQQKMYIKGNNKSMIEVNHITTRNSDISTPSSINRQDMKAQNEKEVSIIIPARKPSKKKDYFVFGMSDRINTSQNKIQIYRDMLWRVNYTNNLFVHTPQDIVTPYKFYVGEGNNSNLIRGILRRRYWWTSVSTKAQQGINFTWTQLKINSLFANQSNSSFIEPPSNQKAQCETTRAASCVSPNEIQIEYNQKLFGRIDHIIWKDHLSKNEKTEKRITEATYQKRLKMYDKKRIKKIDDSRQLTVHNHLEYNFYIGNKKALFYNMKRYLELKGEDPFKMLPLTFHVAKGVDDPQYSIFLKHYELIEEQKKANKALRNIWIVKPGENTNRGNGITVCYNLDDIKMRLRGRQRNGDGKLRTFILQKYIENPLLYNKRKFDIRHYILVTCINGLFKCYWYEEGYVRTSSAEFNIKCCKDPLIHLTNDAIQKNTPQYGKFQKANKLSYAELQKYLQTAYPQKKYSFFDKILPKMKQFATEAIKATYSILDPNRKNHNFELLGLDFMIDQNFEPWLIQVNTNPCLQLCCAHLSRIIPAVVENMFKICLDPLFPPPEHWPSNRKPFCGDDCLSNNKFEIIFDEASDGKEIQRLYNGNQRIDNQMGKIEEDNQTFENDGEVQWQNVQ